MNHIVQEFAFGFKDGKLKRLRYFLYSLVSYIFYIGAFFAFLRNPQSTPIALAFILMTIIFIYLTILFLVKRFRDMGLPPLLSSIIYWAFFLTMKYFSSDEIYYSVMGVISLAIILAPSDAFSKARPTA